MSTTATRLPLAEAISAAERFRALFNGCFERWENAGSIRRQRPEVGDIEHVVISSESNQLLPDGPMVKLLPGRALRLLNDGVVSKHLYGAAQTPRFGDRYIGLDFEGRLHEIFMCTRDNWGCILAIRTGSADFSRGLVSRLPRFGYRQREGFLHNRNGVIACPDEETFFAAAGLDLKAWPPERREAAP